jgi:hypothetical protein
MVYALGEFPTNCQAQPETLNEFRALAGRPPTEIVAYFRSNRDAAQRLLQQSCDKRYTPSTFLEEAESGYRVGWFERDRRHVQHFADLSEAAADYLLFSFGTGRLRCQTI